MGDKDPNNAKKKQVIPQHTHLFDDLIFQEILTRLPIKSVLRFKTVSKQWYSTLSSSNFANAHLMRSPFLHPSAHVNTLFIKSRTSCYVFSYDDDQISGDFEDNLVKLDVEFGVRNDPLVLTGCCNGLICLIPVSGKYFILWNPATRKMHKYALHEYLERFRNTDKVYVASGFGYASSIDDYKYVEILRVKQGKAKSNIVCIFSMRENRWRQIDFCNDHLSLFGQALPVSEKLYWSAYTKEADNLLVSFDLGAERFDVTEIDGDGSDLLGVVRGCLCKCDYSETFMGDQLMHILEPPPIVKSSICLPEGLMLDVFSEMIGSTKTDKLFVMGPLGRDFLSTTLGIVDTCTKQYTTLLRFNKLIKIARYDPSLVSPFPLGGMQHIGQSSMMYDKN